MKKERAAKIRQMWEKMRNKYDVDDVLMDVKVDNARIYQPMALARRVKMKSHRE